MFVRIPQGIRRTATHRLAWLRVLPMRNGDAGVNLIDTADVYSDGAAEEILGRALKGRRDRVLLASKARFPMGSGPNDAGLSRQHLIEACEASLRRLQADHIDLYQVHEWDGQTPLEETLAALDHLVQSGKVRYVGCSNFAGWQVMKALSVARAAGFPAFVSQQVYLSLRASVGQIPPWTTPAPRFASRQ
jgi:aryl-alcohol dehydrogenase-like predicted oxidoreductase